jgi:hypothetical protein
MKLHELKQLYGGAARSSDHELRARITFVEEGKVYTGSLLLAHSLYKPSFC